MKLATMLLGSSLGMSAMTACAAEAPTEAPSEAAGAVRPDASPRVYLVGLRHRGAELAALAARIPGAIVAESEAGEYSPDGNTFAEIKTRLTREHVLLEVPAMLSATDLMELLIKVRAAQSDGARRISLISEKPLREVVIYGHGERRLNIPLERFMNVAGATHVLVPGQSSSREIKRDYPVLKERRPSQSFIFGDTHPELRDELATLLEVGEMPDEGAFDPADAQIYYLAASVPPVNANLFTMLSDINTLSERGAWVDLISPLLPYARADAGRTVIGKLIADLVKAVAPRSITFMRAHAPQSEGFFQPLPTFHLSGRKTLLPYLRRIGVTIVLSPDNGAMKDSTLYAEELDLFEEESGTARLAVINKKRNPKTRKVTLHGITGSSLAGEIAGMPDDEVDTGGTTGKGAALATRGLPEAQRAKEVHAVAVFITGTAQGARDALKSGALTSLITTNAIPMAPEVRADLTVLSVAPELAESLAALKASGTHPLDSACEAQILSALAL